jgi:hypothetical protein
MTSVSRISPDEAILQVSARSMSSSSASPSRFRSAGPGHAARRRSVRTRGRDHACGRWGWPRSRPGTGRPTVGEALEWLGAGLPPVSRFPDQSMVRLAPVSMAIRICPLAATGSAHWRTLDLPIGRPGQRALVSRCACFWTVRPATSKQGQPGWQPLCFLGIGTLARHAPGTKSPASTARDRASAPLA